MLFILGLELAPHMVAVTSVIVRLCGTLSHDLECLLKLALTFEPSLLALPPDGDEAVVR